MPALIILGILFVVVAILAIAEALGRQRHIHNPDLDFTIYPTPEPLSRGLRVHQSQSWDFRTLPTEPCDWQLQEALDLRR